MENQRDFSNYWEALPPESKRSLAKRCNTTYNYLIQIANGHRRPSAALSRTIRKQSGDVVRLSSLRGDIWPRGELPELSAVRSDQVTRRLE